MGYDGEYYEKDGKFYDRPSRILDFFNPPELVDWKVRTGKAESGRISRSALKHGSRVDELIREGKDPIKKDSPEVHSCIKAFKKWKNDNLVADDDIVFPETYFCESQLVAGTADFFWKTKNMIVDIKTSKAVKENYFFQTGFYSYDPKYPVYSVGILRLDKQIEDYELITNEDIGLTIDDCRGGFFSALDHYRDYMKVRNALKPRMPIQAEEE